MAKNPPPPPEPNILDLPDHEFINAVRARVHWRELSSAELSFLLGLAMGRLHNAIKDREP